MSLEGYSLVGGFSRKTHINGGVAGYAREDIQERIRFMEISGGETELICKTYVFVIKSKTNLTSNNRRLQTTKFQTRRCITYTDRTAK